MVQASEVVAEQESSPSENATEVRLQVNTSSETDEETTTGDGVSARPSPRTILANSLRAHTARMRVARVHAEFEQTLLTILTLNVIYMYYIDHKLIVLIIRSCQVIGLFYFPFASPASHRGSAVFLLITNFPVLLIHEMLFTGKGASGNIGEMLFINFIGPEPKSLAKTLTVDCIIITLQVMLLQCKWDLENLGLYILSALPVPISDTLVPVQSTDEPSDTTERENVTEEVEVLSGTT